ncbi:MAG: hypothetical protein WAT79_01055 [Saprospiraceae bacterium]
MNQLKYTLILCILLFSCGKDDFNEGHSILEVSKSKPTEIQTLVKSRLLFAKIVSIAFGNSEFREYYKSNFGTKSKKGHYFEECLLIEHLHDVVLNNGTTLKEFLNNIHDCEVSGIVKENIVDYVLNIDEMVSIKLPDIFLNFEWNINEIIPVVIGTYPEELSNAHFIGYHYCNDSEFYQTGSIPQVFHMYVKYSEDYVLADETNISDFYEYLPQMKTCDESLEKILGERTLYQGKHIVNLKKAYRVWYDLCSFKGNYIDVNGCNEVCQRSCSSPANHNIVLDHISVTEPIFYLANENLTFRESCTMFFQSKDNVQQLTFGDFAVPNLRYAELGRTFNTSGATRKISKVPKMTIIENYVSNEIPFRIKYLISDSPNINLYYNLTLLQYGDIYYKRKYIDSNFQNQFNPENAYIIGTSVLIDCIDATTNFISGDVKLNFRY